MSLSRGGRVTQSVQAGQFSLQRPTKYKDLEADTLGVGTVNANSITSSSITLTDGEIDYKLDVRQGALVISREGAVVFELSR
jgi:hypothetical protein